MAEDVTVSEETLTSSLTLLVNLSKVLLHKAKREAEGRTDITEKHHVTHHVEKRFFYLNCFDLLRNSACRTYIRALRVML